MARSVEDIRRYVRSVLEVDEHEFADAELDEHIRKAHRDAVEYEDWPFLRNQVTLAADTQGTRVRWLLPADPPVRRVLTVWTAEGAMADRQLAQIEYSTGVATWPPGAAGDRVEAYTRLTSGEAGAGAPSGALVAWPDPSPAPSLVVEYLATMPDWPAPAVAAVPGVAAVSSTAASGLPEGLMSAVEYLAVAHACLQKNQRDTGRSYRALGNAALADFFKAQVPQESDQWARASHRNRGRRATRAIYLPYGR